jgi:amidohydrolase
VAKTGAIVRIGGTGPAVGVRAELDALQLQEETAVTWKSARRV